MILFLLRALVLLQGLGLELYVLGRAGGITPDFSAILVAFCLLEVSPGRTPYVLVPLAIGRTLLQPGGLVFHLWVLLVAYLIVLPLRRVLFPERWQFQMLAGALLALVLCWLPGAVLTEEGIDPLGRGALGILLTGIVTPGALLVLRLLYRGVARRQSRIGSPQELPA